MIAIAEKAREQVEEEYPDIDIREKNRLIDERFTKLAYEYEDMMLPGLIKETEEERKIRNECFASGKNTTMMRILLKIRCPKTLQNQEFQT